MKWGTLAATLNYMSSELNKLEEYQKTFIANVSHDFRSPLTSIKVSGSHFRRHHPAGNAGKYLTRVISETERLNKLTPGNADVKFLRQQGYLSAQQVLYSLIDNAIKFSHNGGVILYSDFCPAGKGIYLCKTAESACP